MIAWPNASSRVTLASNGSDSDRYLSVARFAGSHHIVAERTTWKNERICHKVFCPLLGYWRMTKKGRKRMEHNGTGNGDRSEDVRVFETFFESICPHVKKCAIPSYYEGLPFVD